jgi:uncharacterized protein
MPAASARSRTVASWMAAVTTGPSLPMVAVLVHGGLGLGLGPAGPLGHRAGTGIGAITGAFIIARVGVPALVVALLFTGTLALGALADAILG